MGAAQTRWWEAEGAEHFAFIAHLLFALSVRPVVRSLYTHREPTICWAAREVQRRLPPTTTPPPRPGLNYSPLDTQLSQEWSWDPSPDRSASGAQALLSEAPTCVPKVWWPPFCQRPLSFPQPPSCLPL